MPVVKMFNFLHSTYKATLFFVNVLVLAVVTFFAHGTSCLRYIVSLPSLCGLLSSHGGLKSHPHGAVCAGDRPMTHNDGVRNSGAWLTSVLVFPQLSGIHRVSSSKTSTVSYVPLAPSSSPSPSLLTMAPETFSLGTSHGKPVNSSQMITSTSSMPYIQSAPFSCSPITPFRSLQGPFTNSTIPSAAITTSSSAASTDRLLLGEVASRHVETEASGSGQHQLQHDGNITARLDSDDHNALLMNVIRR